MLRAVTHEVCGRAGRVISRKTCITFRRNSESGATSAESFAVSALAKNLKTFRDCASVKKKGT